MAMDHELALVSLQKLVNCLDENFKNRFFLVDGTLLGLVRDGGFIVGDTDIDIGMWIEDRDGRIITDLESAGFQHVCTLGTPESGLMHTFRDGDIKVDVGFYYHQSDQVWTMLFSRGRRLRSSFAKFELQAAQFKGIPVMLPAPHEQYLRIMYGENWRVPATKWNYRYAARNLQAEGGFFWRVAYPVKRALWRLLHPGIYRQRGNG
jgi:hypothetical protein